MLEIRAVDGVYGAVPVLRGLSLHGGAGRDPLPAGPQRRGQDHGAEGHHGAGSAAAGAVTLDGTSLPGLPAHEVPRHGIGYVPQGRRLFAELTVAENLAVGLMTRGSDPARRVDHVLDLFPRLRERLAQRPAR